jgi:hypothetical protein
MARSARDWPWSSYRATIGQVQPPGWLTVDWILSAFGTRKSKAIESYKRFVAAGKNQPSPWTFLKNQIYLGSDKFVERMQKQIGVDRDLSEIPSAQRRPTAKPLSIYEDESSGRDLAILSAYKSGGYSMKEIGDYFGLHYSRVSQIISNSRLKT